MPARTTLSTAAATHGLVRAYQPARRAAAVASARIAAFRAIDCARLFPAASATARVKGSVSAQAE